MSNVIQFPGPGKPEKEPFSFKKLMGVRCVFKGSHSFVPVKNTPEQVPQAYVCAMCVARLTTDGIEGTWATPFLALWCIKHEHKFVHVVKSGTREVKSFLCERCGTEVSDAESQKK